MNGTRRVAADAHTYSSAHLILFICAGNSTVFSTSASRHYPFNLLLKVRIVGASGISVLDTSVLSKLQAGLGGAYPYVVVSLGKVGSIVCSLVLFCRSKSCGDHVSWDAEGSTMTDEHKP